MKLDVESLRALRSVVELGTFTAAAIQLGMSQSAVSWKIKRLEERVGLELVKRGPEIEATPDGRDLLVYAETIISAHDDAIEHLTRSDLAGVVRLGTNEDLRGGMLAEALARFSRMYPQISLEVQIHLSGVVSEWLEAGDVDLALLQVLDNDVRPDDIVLWTEEMSWVHAADVDFDRDLVVPVVTFGQGLIYLEESERSLARNGTKWRTAVRCPMLAGVQSAVEAGLGIAALNERNITDAMTVWKRNDEHRLSNLSEVIRVGGRDDSGELLAFREALATSLSGR